MRAIGHAIKRILGMVLRGIRKLHKIPWGVKYILLPYFVTQPRLALNYVLAGKPRVYYPMAYNARALHPALKTYATHPPVHYTLYSVTMLGTGRAWTVVLTRGPPGAWRSRGARRERIQIMQSGYTASIAERSARTRTISPCLRGRRKPTRESRLVRRD